MKLENQHIEQIRSQFAAMQTKEDLVGILNEANIILYGEDASPIILKSLTYYANPLLSKKRYKSFEIKKKSGGARIIHAPVSGLKFILKPLNLVLQCVYEPHKAANGFVLKKSIVDNAKLHTGNHYVYNIDLKDFFHSFDRNRVKMGFYRAPFNLKKEREPLAFLLASLTTHPFEIDGEQRTVLPQGSPTSPTITNLLCKNLDHKLTGLAKRFGSTYSRYADDITFSSLHSIYNNQKFQQELNRIIVDDQKLELNPKKTRLQKAGFRQEVTGLTVNEKVNVKSRYVKQIRMWLHYWESYGYQKASELFKRDYNMDKSHVKSSAALLENVMDGKLQFLKMVKGETDSTYLKLNQRFLKLSSTYNKLSQLLELWEKEGVEKAMEVYYAQQEKNKEPKPKKKKFIFKKKNKGLSYAIPFEIDGEIDTDMLAELAEQNDQHEMNFNPPDVPEGVETIDMDAIIEAQIEEQIESQIAEQAEAATKAMEEDTSNLSSNTEESHENEEPDGKD